MHAQAICPILLEDYRKISVERKGETNFFTSRMIKDCMRKVSGRAWECRVPPAPWWLLLLATVGPQCVKSLILLGQKNRAQPALYASDDWVTI